MDKQMIEEMAKELCPHYDNGNCYYEVTEVCECCFGCEFCWAISQVLNAGYRKIPENAVVLTREEFDKKLEPFRLGIISLSQELIETSQKLMKARKETAEKFAKLADERIAQRQGERDGYKAFTIDDKAKYDGDIVSLALFEICKEIVEGEDWA